MDISALKNPYYGNGISPNEKSSNQMGIPNCIQWCASVKLPILGIKSNELK